MWRHAAEAIKQKLIHFRFVFRYFIACLNFGLIESTLIVKVRHVNKFETSQKAGNEWIGISLGDMEFLTTSLSLLYKRPTFKVDFFV